MQVNDARKATQFAKVKPVDAPVVFGSAVGTFSAMNELELEHPAAGAMDPGVLVTLSRVAPVENVNPTVWPGADFHTTEPGVGREQQVGSMRGDIAAADPLQDLLIHPPSVKVQRERAASILRRPVVAAVDHQPAMGVTAPKIIRGAIPRRGPTLASVEVPVVGMKVDQLIGMTVRVERKRAGEMGTGDGVPKVAVDGVGEKQLSDVVPVVAPGVGRAAGQYFKLFLNRVISPHSPLQRDPLFIRGSGRPHPPRTGTATTTVQPPVGPETKAVGKVVVILLGDFKPIENDFRRPVGHRIAIAIGNEQQPRWAHQPHSTMSDFDAGQHLDPVGEHGTTVMTSVPIGIFQDNNSIPQVELKALPALGIGVVLRDPQTPP